MRFLLIQITTPRSAPLSAGPACSRCLEREYLGWPSLPAPPSQRAPLGRSWPSSSPHLSRRAPPPYFLDPEHRTHGSTGEALNLWESIHHTQWDACMRSCISLMAQRPHGEAFDSETLRFCLLLTGSFLCQCWRRPFADDHNPAAALLCLLLRPLGNDSSPAGHHQGEPMSAAANETPAVPPTLLILDNRKPLGLFRAPRAELCEDPARCSSLCPTGPCCSSSSFLLGGYENKG